jgi:hypothetical protein
MLEQFLFPQSGEDNHEGCTHSQQDGAPPHYHRDVRKCLNTRFPGRWIGRAAPIPWPPRSPDLTRPDFLLWGFVKDRVYVPPLHANAAEQLQKWRQRCYVACVKKLNTGGTPAASQMEVISNHNCPRLNLMCLSTCLHFKILCTSSTYFYIHFRSFKATLKNPVDIPISRFAFFSRTNRLMLFTGKIVVSLKNCMKDTQNMCEKFRYFSY